MGACESRTWTTQCSARRLLLVVFKSCDLLSRHCRYKFRTVVKEDEVLYAKGASLLAHLDMSTCASQFKGRRQFLAHGWAQDISELKNHLEASKLHAHKDRVGILITVMEEYSFANSSVLDFPVNVRMLVPI